MIGPEGTFAAPKTEIWVDESEVELREHIGRIDGFTLIETPKPPPETWPKSKAGTTRKSP